MPPGDKEIKAMVHQDGTYPSLPLKKDTINVSIAQTRVNGVHYRIAIEVPGSETEAIGKKCKDYGCYIVFGTYAKDPDWPDHILHLMVLIGPDGDVVAKHWKQRNVRGLFPGSEQYTSAIYDVYDRFIEMYGQDAVIPVTKTAIGNIAMSAVQFEPELFRCMAFKGAEIICRVATGGFEYEDMRLTSYHNSLYTLIANNSVNTGNRNSGFFDDTACTAAGSAMPICHVYAAASTTSTTLGGMIWPRVPDAVITPAEREGE